MITNDVSTLKIHKLTQAQYDRELAAGNLDENALYLTPDEDIEIADVVGLQTALDGKAASSHAHAISDVTNLQSSLDSKSDTGHTHSRLHNGVDGTDQYVALVYDSGTHYLRPLNEAVDGGGVVVLGSSGYPYYNLWTTYANTDVLYCNDTAVFRAGCTANFNGDTHFYNAVTFDNSTATIDSYGIYTAYARIQPTNADGYAINLGLAANRWANIFSKSAINVSSDLTVKTDITEIDDRYIELFDLIQPYAYKFIDGTSGRFHTGFISQYVEQAMEQVGLEAEELGFFCKDAMYEEIKDENGKVIEEKPLLDEDGNQRYFYSLRYEEYIAIMTEKIKRMEKRIDELETKLEKVDEIEARLAALETA